MTIGNCCRMVVVKSFTYRDEPEEFSNGYTFIGPSPSDSASWDVLRDDVVRVEQPCFPGTVKYVRVYGYTNNDPKQPHAYAYTWPLGSEPVGTFQETGTGHPMAGDQAGLVSFGLARKSDKGKPTYLRKYMHAGFVDATDRDKLAGDWLTALGIFTGPAGIQSVHGGLMSPGGPLDGDPPPGSNVTAAAPSPWVTTRTLKRRGKRPKTA